jgi:hypothetical protein
MTSHKDGLQIDDNGLPASSDGPDRLSDGPISHGPDRQSDRLKLNYLGKRTKTKLSGRQTDRQWLEMQKVQAHIVTKMCY